MYKLFNEYRAKHESDADETKYNEILDTMDAIYGQGCHPNCYIFESKLRM